MTKNFKYILIQLLIIFVFFLLVPPFLIRERIIIDKSGGQATFNLSQNEYFEQKINHHAPNINSLSLQLKNPQIKNNSLITVQINDSLGNLVKDFTFYGSNIGDPSWVKLKFSPLNIQDFQIKIFSERDSNDLYLYIDKNNQLDLITTSFFPGFKNRFITNINFQIKQISERSLLHNVFYLFTLILLNIYFFMIRNSSKQKIKQLTEN